MAVYQCEQDARSKRPFFGLLLCVFASIVLWQLHASGARRLAPLFVARRTQDVDSCAPLPVVRIRVVYTQRDAGVAAVAVHRTVERQLDRTAFEAEEAGLAVAGRLEGHAKSQSRDVE